MEPARFAEAAPLFLVTVSDTDSTSSETVPCAPSLSQSPKKYRHNPYSLTETTTEVHDEGYVMNGSMSSADGAFTSASSSFVSSPSPNPPATPFAKSSAPRLLLSSTVPQATAGTVTMPPVVKKGPGFLIADSLREAIDALDLSPKAVPKPSTHRRKRRGNRSKSKQAGAIEPICE